MKPSSISGNNKITSWAPTLSAGLFFCYCLLQMKFVNSISTQLIDSFSIDATQVGFFAASYFYGNAVFLIPAGILLDKYSTRYLLLTAITTSIIGTLIIVQANSIYIASLGRFINGVCSAFSFLGCVKLISWWHPPNRRSVTIGLIVTLGMFGGMIAQTPFAMVSEWLGWQRALTVNIFFGLITFVIIWLNVFDHPDRTFSKQPLKSFLKNLKETISHYRNWLYGLYAGLMNLPLTLLGALWGTYYLSNERGLSLQEASYASLLMFLGMMVGSPLIGWLSDKFGKRENLMKVLSTALFFIMLVVIFLPINSVLVLCILFFLLGVFSGAQVLSFTCVTEQNPMKLTSTAMSLCSVVIFSTTAITQPLFGWLVEKQVFFNSAMQASVEPLYALLLIPLGAILSVLICIFTGKKPIKPKL